MPLQARELILLATLASVHGRDHPGYSVRAGECGGVVLERRGHLLGLWRCIDDRFFWTPAGYNEPTLDTGDLEDATRYTWSRIVTS